MVMGENLNAMKNSIKHWWDSMPAKGGLIGALFGALVSSKFHRQGDKPLKNAGKTALFSGAGFMLGQWIDSLRRNTKQHRTRTPNSDY
jgi:hypothetical protein